MIGGNINFDAYNTKADIYIESNIDGHVGGNTASQRVKKLKNIMSSGSVFEIGSGGGNDALELQNNGYTVYASDFVPSFIDILCEKGLQTYKFNALEDEFPVSKLDCIWANAVLVHFSKENIKLFLQKAFHALQINGHIFMSIIYGSGTEVSARQRGIEREFYYHTPEDMCEIIKNNGYKIEYIEYPVDTKWIQIIISKQTP